MCWLEDLLSISGGDVNGDVNEGQVSSKHNLLPYKYKIYAPIYEKYVINLLLLLIWLYNSFIEFWPSQPTLSIFFYLGQKSYSLVLLSSVYLF